MQQSLHDQAEMFEEELLWPFIVKIDARVSAIRHTCSYWSCFLALGFGVAAPHLSQPSHIFGSGRQLMAQWESGFQTGAGACCVFLALSFSEDIREVRGLPR